MRYHMVSRQVWSKEENTIDVSVTRYESGTETWFFSIGEKEYFYQKPSYARARLEKLGYKYIDTVYSKII